MRTSSSSQGFTVKGYAGTTGILLAFDSSASARRGLLGFAIERMPASSRPADRKKFGWLKGMLRFPGQEAEPGEQTETAKAPIQKFRWSDYRVFPDTDYTYRVHAVKGSPNALEVGEPVEIALRTESLKKGDHQIVFNRAAAASQAFSREFPEVEEELKAAKREKRPHRFTPDSDDEVFKKAFTWLSRGVLERLLSFIRAAKDSKWALDVAIYEYELAAIVAAVQEAHKRGVKVRLIYHAKEGDPQTEENEHNLRRLPKASKRGRVTTKIFHNKFIVLSKLKADGTRVPQAVLCGSTNFTENGVYRQANVVHVVSRPEVAREYLSLFEFLWENPDDPAAAKTRNSTENPMNPEAGLFAGFSPRKGKTDLDEFLRIVEGADRDVLFATVFSIHHPLLQALAGRPHDPILRFGVQNSRSEITGFHADRTAQFSTVAMLNHGLEGWLKETTQGQKGNILIHTKAVVTDFTSDSPTVISGSHNLSLSASGGNDENYLIVRGDSDVADVYGIEILRLYDHYRFRFVQGQSKGGPPPSLVADDSWTDRYYTPGSLQEADRLRFAGV